MWSAAQICRCSQSIRSIKSKIFYNVGPRLITRELITPAHCSRIGLRNTKSFRISELIKSNGIIARYCASSPKTKTSKAVGYWLFGCSGMVFAAVVLGMAVSYGVLLYCVCYVINVIVRSVNGSK